MRFISVLPHSKILQIASFILLFVGNNDRIKGGYNLRTKEKHIVLKTQETTQNKEREPPP